MSYNAIFFKLPAIYFIIWSPIYIFFFFFFINVLYIFVEPIKYQKIEKKRFFMAQPQHFVTLRCVIMKKKKLGNVFFVCFFPFLCYSIISHLIETLKKKSLRSQRKYLIS